MSWKGNTVQTRYVSSTRCFGRTIQVRAPYCAFRRLLLCLAANIVAANIILGQFCFAAAQESSGQSVDEAALILAEQSALAGQYRLLEEKLFSLYEYERDSNPMRSGLLKRAYLQSQEQMTAGQLDVVAELISGGDLKQAEAKQAKVLTDLNALLKLLESEDRGKRVRDDIRRNQVYLKEVERILRIQRGIRTQAEADGDAKRLEESQEKTADRTGSLAGEIEDEERDESESGEGAESDEGNETEEGADENGNEAAGNDNGQSGEGQSGEGQSGEGGEGEHENAPNPVPQQIESAEQKMREAAEDLKRAQREDSIEDMKAAEAAMAEAKKELEDILRQLREEEIERTLAMLEGRFRQMLEREIKVLERTQALDATPASERGTNFEIAAGKQSLEQNGIATEAGRALMLLDEDGSSVAFPETVDQMRDDMLQVAGRLSAAMVGAVTVEIETDIVETLGYIVEALVQTQEDMERMKQANQQQGGGGPPGEKPLVDQLAEIKMLRSLQERIYKRHLRYSKMLPDPEDPVGMADDPEIQAALDRLAERQRRLTEIAEDIVAGKIK